MRTLAIALIIVLSASVAMAQRSTIIHKEQIEDAYIYNTGDTMEGDLIINGTATVEGVFNANDDVNVKYIDFDLLYTGGNYEGRLQWNNEDGTLEYGLGGGNVNLQIGQEEVVRVTNKTGFDIPNGSAVYVNGAQGQRPTVALASASLIGNATKVLGITTEDIPNNNSGYVTTHGLVRGVNTLAYSEGSILYLSENAPGGFQSTEPVSLRYIVIVGMVLYQHATEGVILACPKFYYNPAPFSITGVGAITVEKDGENYTLTVPTPVPTATAISVPTLLPTSTPQPTATPQPTVTPQATPTPWNIVTQGNISSQVGVSNVTLTVPTPAPTMIVEASGTNIIVTGTEDTWYIESPGNFPESLGGRYQETIISPTTTVYVNHGLGYQDVYVGIRDTVTNYVGMPSVILSTTDQVRIGFAAAPTNPIEVVVIAGGYGSIGEGVTDHGSLTGLADYDHTWALHKTIAGTVTAVHTFSPSSVGPPFSLGMTAQGQLVDGFNSDEWNGWDTLVVQGHGNLTTADGNAVVTIFTPVPTATAITIPTPVPTATEKPNPTAQPTVKITGSGQAGITPIVGGYNVDVPALPTATNTPTVTPTFTPPPTPRPEVTLVAQGIAEVTRVAVNNYQIGVRTPVPTATAITIPTPVPTATEKPNPTAQPTATPQATPTPWSIITQGNISSNVDVSSVTLTVPTPAPTMIVEASGTNIIVTGTDDTWYIESPGNFPESLGGRYQETITSPTTTVYVNHGLGYQDVYVGIRDTVTNYVGMPSVILSTTDQVRIGFASAPTNPIEVVVIAGGYGSTGEGVTDHGSLTGLADYDHTWALHKTIAGTVTAVHTFSPSSVGPPFTLGMTADGQLVDGFNSDEWNGWDTLVVQGHGTLATFAGNALVTIYTPVPTSTAIPTPTPVAIGGTGVGVVQSVTGWHLTVPTPVPTSTAKPYATPVPTDTPRPTETPFDVEGKGAVTVVQSATGWNVEVPTAVPTATAKPAVPTSTPQPTSTPHDVEGSGAAVVVEFVTGWSINVPTPAPTSTAKPVPTAAYTATPQPTATPADVEGKGAVTVIQSATGWNIDVPTPVPTATEKPNPTAQPEPTLVQTSTPQPTPTPIDVEGSGSAVIVQHVTGWSVDVPTPVPTATEKPDPTLVPTVPTATEKPNPTPQPTVKITGSGQAGVTPIAGGYNVNVPALPTATNTPTVTPTFTPPPTPRPEVTLVAQGIAEVTRVSVNNYQIGVRTPVPTATAKPNPTPQPTLKVASNNNSVHVTAITGGYNLTVSTPVPTLAPATPQPTPTPFDIEGSGIATVVQSSTGYNVNVPTFYPSPTPYASDKYFVFGDGTNTTYSWYIPSAGSYPIVRVREVVSPYREILCGINWSGDTFTFRTATPPAPNSLIAYCLPNDAMSVNQNPTHTLNSIDLIFTAYDVLGNVIQSPVTIVNTSTLSISSHIKVLSFKKLLYKESFAIGTKSMTVNHLLNQRNIIANVIYGGSVGTNISSYTYAMDSFTVGALSNYAGAVVVWEPLEFGNFELDLVAHPTPLPTATPFSVEGDGSVTVVKTESSYIVSVPTFAPTWTPRPTDTPPPTPAPTATEKPNPTAQPTLSITGSGAASVSSISGGYNVDVPTPAPTATIKPEPTAQPTVKITGSGSASITPIAGGYNVAVPTPVPTATIKPNPTPDGNKIDKVIPAPENKFPYFNSSGGIKDSGYDGSSFAAYIHNHDSYYISIIPDPSTGNFPLMTSGGELETSVFGPGSFATSSHNHNHNDLLNIDVNQHRTMNDLTTSSTTLWSSSKITSTLQGYIDVDGVNWQYVPAGTYHGKVDVPSKWYSVIAYDNYKLYTGSERFQISHSANVLVMDASTSDVQIKTEDKVFFSNSAGINSATVDVSESSIEADFGKFNFIQFKRDYTEAESSSLPNGSGFILDTGEEIGFGFKDLDGNVDLGRMYTADEIVSSVTLSDDAKYTYVGIKYDFDGNGTTDTKYLAMYKQ